MTYPITQFLTGHGCFATYLYKFKRRQSPACMYGDSDDDTAEHMLFHCERFHRLRTNTELTLGERLGTENLIELMLRNRRSWETIGRMMQQMIETKEKEEKEVVIMD